MIPCGAGGGDTKIGTTGSQMDGYLAGSHIGNRHRDKERRDLSMPVLPEKGMIVLYRCESSHTTADEHPNARRIHLRDLEMRILQGHNTGAHGILGKPVHLLEFF